MSCQLAYDADLGEASDRADDRVSVPAHDLVRRVCYGARYICASPRLDPQDWFAPPHGSIDFVLDPFAMTDVDAA